MAASSFQNKGLVEAEAIFSSSFLQLSFSQAFSSQRVFFVALVDDSAVGLALVLAVGFGVGVDVAARAEVVESVSTEIKKVAINFFNLCST